MPKFEHPTLGTWTIRHQRGFGVAKRSSGKPDNRYATVVTIEAPPIKDRQGDYSLGSVFKGVAFWKQSEDAFNKQIALGMAFRRALDEIRVVVSGSEYTPLKSFLKASFRKIQQGKRIPSGRPVERQVPPVSEPQISAHVM